MKKSKLALRKKMAFAAALALVSNYTWAVPVAAAQTNEPDISSDQNGSEAADHADTEQDSDTLGGSTDPSAEFAEYSLVFDNIRFTELQENYADAYAWLLGSVFDEGFIHDVRVNNETNELMYVVDKNYIPRAKDYVFDRYGILFKYRYVRNNVMHFEVYYRYHFEYNGDYSNVPMDACTITARHDDDYIAYKSDGDNALYNYFKAGAEMDIVPSILYSCADDTDHYIARADYSGVLRREDSGDEFKLIFGGKEYRFVPRTFDLDLTSPDYHLSDRSNRYPANKSSYEIKWKDIESLTIESDTESKKTAYEISSGSEKAVYIANDGKIELKSILDTEGFKFKKGIKLTVSGIDEFVTAAVRNDGSETAAEEIKLPVKKNGEQYSFEVPYLAGDGRFLASYYYGGKVFELDGEAFASSESGKRCREIAYKNDMKGITLNYVKLGRSSAADAFSYKQSAAVAKRNNNCFTYEALGDSAVLADFGEKFSNKRVIVVSSADGGLKLSSFVPDKNSSSFSVEKKEMEKSGFVLVRNVVGGKDGEFTDSLQNGICFYLDRTAPGIENITPSSDNSVKKWKDGKGMEVSFEVKDTETYPFNDDKLPYYDARELHDIYDNYINAESADKQEIASIIAGDYRFDRPAGGWSAAKEMSGYIENEDILKIETKLIEVLRGLPMDKIGSYGALETYSSYRELLHKSADTLSKDITAYCENLIKENTKKLSSDSSDSKNDAVKAAIKKLEEECTGYQKLFADYSSSRKSARAASGSVPTLTFDTESRRFILNFKPGKGREKDVINDVFEVYAVDNSNNKSSKGQKIYVDIDAQAPAIGNINVGTGIKAKTGGNVYVLREGNEISVEISDGKGSGVRDARILFGEGSEAKPMLKGKKAGEYVYTVSESDISGNNKKIPIIVEAEDGMGNNSSFSSENNAEPRLFIIDETGPVCSIRNISAGKAAYVEELTDGSSRTWFRGYQDIVLAVSAEDVDPDICSGIDSICITVNGRANTIKLADGENSIDTAKLAAGEYNIIFRADENTDTFSADLKCGDDTVSLGSGYALNGDGSINVSLTAEDTSFNRSDAAYMVVFIDKSVPRVTSLLIDGSDVTDRDGVYDYVKFSGHSVGIDVVVAEGENSSGIRGIEAVLIYSDGREETVEVPNNGFVHNTVYRLVLPVNFKGKVKVTAVSNAGRTSEEVFTDGIVTESYQQHSGTSNAYIELPDTPYRDAGGNPLYRGAVNARVTVMDSFSGIGSVTVNASGMGSESYDIMSDRSGWTIPEGGTDHNLVLEASRDISISENSNGNSISLGFDDNSGNHVPKADERIFSIDTVDPRVAVSFIDAESNAGKTESKIFRTARKAVISVTERNFDKSRMEVTVNGTAEKLEWNLTGGTEGTDTAVYSAVREFDSDGDYKLVVRCTDMCGRDSNVVTEDFVIDMTAPVLTNVFDNRMTNDHYYSQAVTASFTINESNFDPKLIAVTGTFNDSTAGFPTFTEWTSSGSQHTATVRFDKDGEYTVRISGSDKAGNVMETYAGTFCVDSRKPTIAAESVIKSSNAKEIRPRIMFEDTNINKESIKIKVNGANRGNDLDLGGQLNEVDGGYEYIFDNIPDKEENDDIYKVRASAKDNADNKIEKDFSFSVNRYGSVFEIDSDTRSIRGRFVPAAQDIVIIERNPDTHAGPQNVYITKDSEMIELKEGEDYTVEYRGGNGEWSEYTYRVFAKNFENDARYSVSIHTRDEAGNINISNSEKKNADVAFCIDKTKPLCIPLDINENTAYKNESITAHLAVSDNIMLKNVKVYIDGSLVRSRYLDDECAFVIPNAKHAQNVRVVLTDMAENEIEYNYRNILVTTSAIRILFNKLWFKISCGAAALLAAAAAVFIKTRKKRLL